MLKINTNNFIETQNYINFYFNSLNYTNKCVMLVVFIHLISFFTLVNFFSSYYDNYSSFFFVVWLFVSELIVFTFYKLYELDIIFNFIFYFYFFYFFIFLSIVYIFYLKFFIMAKFTIYDYTQYFWQNFIDNFFFFFKKKNKNNNSLNTLLDKKNIQYIEYFFNLLVFFFILFIYLHIKYIAIYFKFNFIDLTIFISLNKTNIFILLYFFFLIKISLNSLFFNQIFSLNKITLFNIDCFSEISDDVMDWEALYWEKIILTENTYIEYTEMYTFIEFMGERRHNMIEKYKQSWDYFNKYSRYRIPLEFISFKTYKNDSYDNNTFYKYSNVLNDFFFWLFNEEDENFSLFLNEDLEKNLPLKI